MSRHFPATRRETRDALTTRSQGLLEQAGYIRNASAPGIFNLLPLGWRTHQRICDIVFQEMERDGVHNMQLPILQPKELWDQTGRWDRYIDSKTMFVTQERHTGALYGLAPTAEEMVTALAAAEVQSWRDLPLILHQIGPKFRDEIRPRMGLLRGREFVMSDAYSFDRDEAGMRDSFELFRGLYNRIFDRCGLRRYISVQADSGSIGGQGSAEYMAVCDVGEDVLLTCDSCDYGANAEKAASLYSAPEYSTTVNEMHVESTPNVMTVDQLRSFFPLVTADRMVKTIIFTINPASPAKYHIALCIRGDLEVNEVKLRNALSADEVAAAEAADVKAVTGARVGFAGPIGLENVSRIMFDRSVESMTNFLCGLNRDDYHALDVNFGRDLPRPEQYFDLHVAKEGHTCANCLEGSLAETRGIEVGHIFMLQQGYARSMNAVYSDESGQQHVVWMGCYGIGTTRLLQAIVEQCNDDGGIIWPKSVSPYDVYVVPIRYADAVQRELSDKMVDALESAGVAVVYDDRMASPGVKFADADLLGFPWRITIGRGAAAGRVELVDRATRQVEEMDAENAIERIVTSLNGGQIAQHISRSSSNV